MARTTVHTVEINPRSTAFARVMVELKQARRRRNSVDAAHGAGGAHFVGGTGAGSRADASNSMDIAPLEDLDDHFVHVSSSVDTVSWTSTMSNMVLRYV